ncbi:hypothetical protein EV359DRAFT_59624 [Lentinula novae-zelandiae]|nr:hypothetical protein EV359DRAFT_59624 [Lentinula novae-zelandiae]
MTTLPNVAAIPDLSTDDIRERILGYLSGQGLGQLSHEEMDKIISKFPRLNEKQIIALGHEGNHSEQSTFPYFVCPICFVPLTTLLAEEKTGLAMDSPAYPIEELGITKLAEPFQCNHIFCRRELSFLIKPG